MKVKRLARASLDRLGLSILYYRFYEWRHSKRLPAVTATAPDGRPLPTPYLMTLVAGGPDPDWFLASGKDCADGLHKRRRRRVYRSRRRSESSTSTSTSTSA